MSDQARHWRRPLKSGGVEFQFVAAGSKLQGSVAPARVADDLQRLFEQLHGVRLPPPEVRPMRGVRG